MQGGKYTVEGTMEAAVPADTVFQLLCDYGRVAEVFSNVLRSSTYHTVGADTRLQQVTVLLKKSYKWCVRQRVGVVIVPYGRHPPAAGAQLLDGILKVTLQLHSVSAPLAPTPACSRYILC